MNSVRNRIYAGLVAFLVLCAFASLLKGATVPESVPLGKFVRVKLDEGEKAIVLSQDFAPVDIITTKDSLAFTGLPGRYVVVVLKGDEQPQQFFTKITGTAPPVDPPKPDDPPKPEPDKVAPIPLPGLRVLMVFESSKGPPSSFIDGNIQEWLTSNCAVGESNTAEWRMIDQNDHFLVGKSSEHWKAAAERPRSGIPWVVISNGTTGYEGAPPVTADQFLELLKRFK